MSDGQPWKRSVWIFARSCRAGPIGGTGRRPLRTRLGSRTPEFDPCWPGVRDEGLMIAEGVLDPVSAGRRIGAFLAPRAERESLYCGSDLKAGMCATALQLRPDSTPIIPTPI